jgi:hypothetical protein
MTLADVKPLPGKAEVHMLLEWASSGVERAVIRCWPREVKVLTHSGEDKLKFQVSILG